MLHTFYLGILLCAVGSFALYDSSSDVVTLTPSNFDKLVINSDEVWVVEFFAPWCGHCKNLVEPYKKAAKALKGIAKVGAIDANEHQSYGQKYGITGFPTVKIFVNGKASKLEGPNTAEGIVDGALKATKEKAYAALGRKGGSDKKRLYGHNIPWKKAVRTDVTATTHWETMTTPRKTRTKSWRESYYPRVVTTEYGKKRLQQLQVHLFRRRFGDNDTPKIVRPRRLTQQMRNKRF